MCVSSTLRYRRTDGGRSDDAAPSIHRMRNPSTVSRPIGCGAPSSRALSAERSLRAASSRVRAYTDRRDLRPSSTTQYRASQIPSERRLRVPSPLLRLATSLSPVVHGSWYRDDYWVEGTSLLRFRWREPGSADCPCDVDHGRKVTFCERDRLADELGYLRSIERSTEPGASILRDPPLQSMEESRGSFRDRAIYRLGKRWRLRQLRAAKEAKARAANRQRFRLRGRRRRIAEQQKRSRVVACRGLT